MIRKTLRFLRWSIHPLMRMANDKQCWPWSAIKDLGYAIDLYLFISMKRIKMRCYHRWIHFLAMQLIKIRATMSLGNWIEHRLPYAVRNFMFLKGLF